MRVLVCGGRDFSDTVLLYRTLDSLREREQVDCIIEGAARGADRIAGYWAKKNRIDLRLFPADWSLGKKAGHVRNKQMLDEGKPDLVIAFPTDQSRGTWDMVRQSKAAGVEVVVVTGRSGQVTVRADASGTAST